jgi:hypothetical protein
MKNQIDAVRLLGAMTFVSAMVDTIYKTYLNGVEITTNCHKILVAGMLDGLLDKNSKVGLDGGRLEAAFEQGAAGASASDQSILDKIKETIANNYDKQYQGLKNAVNADIETSILQYPKKWSEKNDLDTLLAAAVKLAHKISPEQSKLYERLADGPVKVKALSNLVSGTLLANIFRAGKKIGQAIAKKIEPRVGKSFYLKLAEQLKENYFIYDYGSEVYRKFMQAPAKLLGMGVPALIAFNTGLIDAAVEKDNVGLDGQKLAETTNNSYFSQLKGAMSIAYNNFIKGVNFQWGKTSKLNDKLVKAKAKEDILQEKPWKEPAELLARDAMKDKTIFRGIMDGSKALIAGTNATILSSSYALGRLVGGRCLRVKRRSSLTIEEIDNPKPVELTSATPPSVAKANSVKNATDGKGPRKPKDREKENRPHVNKVLTALLTASLEDLSIPSKKSQDALDIKQKRPRRPQTRSK